MVDKEKIEQKLMKPEQAARKLREIVYRTLKHLDDFGEFAKQVYNLL